MILSSLFTMSSTPPWIGLMPTSKSAKAGVGSARPFPAGGHDNTSPWLWHVCARSSARKPWTSTTPPSPEKSSVSHYNDKFLLNLLPCWPHENDKFIKNPPLSSLFPFAMPGFEIKLLPNGHEEGHCRNLIKVCWNTHLHWNQR